MNTLGREQVLSRLQQLPSLPTVVSALLASFDNEDIDIGQIAHQIGCDQGLTARVLRVANSSFYGLQSRVGTIHEAVVVLGFRAVRSMVLAVGMNASFRGDLCPGFDVLSYLRHCVAVGLAARAIAPLSGQNPELAFTSGVLHDIGQLVLASNFSAQYTATLAHRKAQDCFLIDAERAVLGMDHAEVGSLLAEIWRFPEPLHEAVARHHAPLGGLADLIHVADTLAHALALSDNEMVMPVDPAAWQRLGLTDEKLKAALPQIEQGLEETSQAFSG